MLNRVCIAGRMTRDPELKRTQTGKAVCTVRIAVDKKDGTDFFDVVTWNGLAENMSKNTRKGKLVVFDGRLQTREYEKDGIKRTVTEIVADSATFAGEIPKEKPQLAEIDEEGELPF